MFVKASAACVLIAVAAILVADNQSKTAAKEASSDREQLHPDEILERAEEWYAQAPAYRDQGEISRTVTGPRAELGTRRYRDTFRQQFSRPHEYEFVLERDPNESRGRSTVVFTLNSQGVRYELRFEDEGIVHEAEYDELRDADGDFRAQPFHMTHADLIGLFLPDEATHQAKVHNPIAFMRERNHGAGRGKPREIARLVDEEVDGTACFVLRAGDVRQTEQNGRVTERITLWIQHDPPVVRKLEQKTLREIGMEMPMTDTRVTTWQPEVEVGG